MPASPIPTGNENTVDPTATTEPTVAADPTAAAEPTVAADPTATADGTATTNPATSEPTAPPEPEVRPRSRSAKNKKPPPPTTLVLLVRHGTTPTTGQVLPGRAAGLHLSEAGLKQAETVARRLHEWVTMPRPEANVDPKANTDAAAKAPKRPRKRDQAEPNRRRIAAVYASPLERTSETAAPIAAALGLEVTTEAGLLECDFGEWTGAELKELMKRPEWATVQRYPSGFRFPGGESFTAMQARIVDTITALRRQHPGETIVTVSHADPIKAAVADALGSHLDLFQRIVISPCSVTAISYGPLGPTVLAVNSTAALTELVPS